MIIVSACLAGFNCRYDGKNQANKKIIKLIKNGKAIPVCPEQLGGLPTPRPAVEKVGNKFISHNGENYSREFKKGAKEAFKIAKLVGCKKAILKAKSPSCGCGLIYDGSFSGRLKKGNGIFCSLLKKNKIKVVSL